MSKISDTIDGLKGIIAHAEFGERTQKRLWKYRFKYIYNNDKKTLEAIFAQAEKTLCQWCMGAGKQYNSTCEKCSGTGERAYDPHIKTVEEVLDK